MNTYLIESES